VLEYAGERFDRQFEFSAERRYLNTPKKRKNRLNIDWLALFEHEYGIEIAPGRIEKARSEVFESLKNLLGSGILERASATDPSDWAIEDIDFSEFAQSFYLEGVKIFVKTDFIFRTADGELNIVDWKTYRKARGGTGDDDQLGVYGYYAASELEEPPENVILTEVNLLNAAAERSFRLNHRLLDRAAERIENGIEKLSSLLIRSDTESNEPLPEKSFRPAPGDQCRFCNFRRICAQARLG
jgi:hypothetical protein